MNWGPIFAISVATLLAAVNITLALRYQRPLTRSDRWAAVVMGVIWVVFVVAMVPKI